MVAKQGTFPPPPHIHRCEWSYGHAAMIGHICECGWSFDPDEDGTQYAYTDDDEKAEIVVAPTTLELPVPEGLFPTP